MPRQHELTPDRLTILGDYVLAAWSFARERDAAVTVEETVRWWMAYFGWPGPEDSRHEGNVAKIAQYVRGVLPPSLVVDDQERADRKGDLPCPHCHCTLCGGFMELCHRHKVRR